MRGAGRYVALLGAALFGLVACEREATTPASKKPNLVLIVIDTLRPDRLPFYGHSGPTAPFLDELSEKSLVFSRAHSTSSWTAPAMASLFLSLHPFQHGMHLASLSPDGKNFDIRVLPESVPSLPESLKAVGYRTFAVTDNQNVSEPPGFARGFDRFFSTHYQSAAAVNETLLRWRDDILSGEPYFLYVHYMDPHLPYNGREPWYGRDPASGSDDEVTDALARYDSEIRYADEHIAELFAAFGWGEGTVVIVTSDHGEEFGEHGGEQHGRTLHAEVLDVPLLMYAPAQFPDGRRIDRRVSIIDVAPTFLDLAGHPGEPTYVGTSLRPDAAWSGERSIYSQLITESGKSRRRSEVRGVIRGRYKLLDHQSGADELFDLQADSAETQSILDDHPDLGAELAAELEAEVSSVPRFEPGTARIPLDSKKIEKLKALGYAE